MKTVTHASACPWRNGGECFCGGNRAWEPKTPPAATVALCVHCEDSPCTCAAYAVPLIVWP